MAALKQQQQHNLRDASFYYVHANKLVCAVSIGVARNDIETTTYFV